MIEMVVEQSNICIKLEIHINENDFLKVVQRMKKTRGKC